MTNRIKAGCPVAAALAAAVLFVALPAMPAQEIEPKYEEQYLLPPQEI